MAGRCVFPSVRGTPRKQRSTGKQAPEPRKRRKREVRIRAALHVYMCVWFEPTGSQNHQQPSARDTSSHSILPDNVPRSLSHSHSLSLLSTTTDISTSFRRGPVPRPLVNHTSGPQQPEDEDDLSSSVIIGIPPPAVTSSSAAPLKSATTTNPAISQAQAAASAGLSLLGEPCRIGAGGGGSSRASSGGGEPVIALAATAPVLTAQDLGLLSLVVDDSPVSTTDSDADSTDALWAAEPDDPLASFDRVLDGLLVAPVPQPAAFTTPSKPPSSSSSSSPSTNSVTLSSLLAEQPFVASSTPAAGQAPQPDSAAAGERRSRSGKSARLAAAAAAPAVTVVHCETEFERELQAAAALQQLLVVKFESSQHLVSESIALGILYSLPCLFRFAHHTLAVGATPSCATCSKAGTDLCSHRTLVTLCVYAAPHVLPV